jgi:hypothetical protein
MYSGFVEMDETFDIPSNKEELHRPKRKMRQKQLKDNLL